MFTIFVPDVYEDALLVHFNINKDLEVSDEAMVTFCGRKISLEYVTGMNSV